MSYYVHHIPGRLRIKIPTMKGNYSMAETVQRMLQAKHGVDSVVTNPVTGSVLINYDSAFLADKDLLSFLSEQGFFDNSKVIANDEYLNKAFSKAGQVVGKALFGIVLEKAFEGSALSYLAAFI